MATKKQLDRINDFLDTLVELDLITPVRMELGDKKLIFYSKKELRLTEPEKQTEKKEFDSPTPEQLEARQILERMDKGKLTEAEKQCGKPDPVPDAPKRKRRSSVVELEPFKLSESPNDDIPESHQVTTSILIPEAIPVEITSTPIPELNLPERAPVIENLPTSDQMKEFRTSLFKFTNEILPQGGMVPTEGIGGVATKIRMYARTLFPSVSDLKYLTVDQWITFLGLLNDSLQQNGSAELVRLINKEIGIIE